MDKYTVDLDQVLNDFEYSELTTEQQSSNNSIDQLPSQQHVKHYSNAKHSINNVFSSLNDYLNSEINENVEYKDNNYDNNLAYQRSTISIVNATSGSTSNQQINNISSAVSLQRNNCTVVSPEIPIEDLTGASKEKEIVEADNKLIHDHSDQIVNITPVKERPLESLISDPILLKIDDEQVADVQDLEDIKEMKETFLSLISNEESTKDLNEIVNLSCHDTSQLSHNCQNNLENFESFVNNETNFMKLHEELNAFSIEHEVQHVTNIEITSNDGDAVKTYEETTEQVNVEELCNYNVDSTNLSCDKIGFHVEVDDEEAAKYLEELDDEDEIDMQYENRQDLHENNESNEHKEEETVVKSDESQENMENLEKVEVLLTKDEEHKQNKRGSDENVIEIEEVMNDEACSNANIVKGNDHRVRIKLAETQRPNSLDIKDDVVNIMGNPGSTPYNNLYVSKEVNLNANTTTLNPHIMITTTPTTTLTIANVNKTNQNHPNYESESSASSVSPTFSEASTDSVHSTDSPILNQKSDDENQENTNSKEEAENDNDNVNENAIHNDGKESNNEEDEEEDGADDDEDDDEEDHENDENVNANENNEISPGDMTTEEEENVQENARIRELSEDGANHHQISEEEEVYVDLDSINNEPVEGSCSETIEQGQGETTEDALWLGKRAPVWIPDADALTCQHCEFKFTVIKRRHHCRACGLVLCSKCCNMKHKLEYLGAEARVCTRCYDLLNRETDSGSGDSQHSTPNRDTDRLSATGQPNPNNPMEYCSIVPPHQQVEGGDGTPPSVMVPVGVLKRKGSNKKHNKSVMFCDGIRPGSDLTNLDNDFNYNENRKSASTSQTKAITQAQSSTTSSSSTKVNKNLPAMDRLTRSFIPSIANRLPPTVTTYKSDITYSECGNNANVVEMLKNETLTFAVQRNLHIHVRLINMDCCVNKQAWCFTTEGLISVGQDEIVILLEYMENETQVPKDIFHHLNNIYNSAVKGTTVTELGLSLHPIREFLDSRNHAGFIFVRPSFQCLQNVIVPKEPFLVGVLVHRWETPWARIFPLRLVLRLGAEYRYYPSPLISTRNRDSVFVEIGHTIINLLADFRNFSYTLPNIRGLTIHMEEKSTTVAIPVNRYDQVMKTISNSSEHILAFGGNFSSDADSHLVCIQDTQGSNENSYKTHAINIQNKPRKVTGASFIVFNGALKSSTGLTAKSSIVEDGLMIQIPPEHMIKVRESLRNMKNHTIQCGCINATSDETVNIVWTDADVNFNIGVKSSVDGQSLSGVPSIRVHNGKDYTCNSGTRLIRWTEVFLLQNGEENARTQDPVDISKVAESISKATCQALVKYLDLLATNSFMKIGIRTTLHVDDVSYSAGSNGTKLPPIYMKSLDNELVPVLHGITSAGNVGDGTIVLELIFRILNV